MDHLVVSLLNTVRAEHDPLESAPGAARLWSGTGISLPGKPRFDPGLASGLRALRAALEASLRGVEAPLPLSFRADDADGVLFEILHAARTAMADGTLRRIRPCAGQECGRYFLDQTKNGSRRWCSMRCMERARAPRRRTISR